MKYYKAMNKDFTCRGFQYEIGKTYELPKSQKLELCENGFHFCENVDDCFELCSKDDCIICEVKPLGRISLVKQKGLLATDKIEIVKILPDEIVERVISKTYVHIDKSYLNSVQISKVKELVKFRNYFWDTENLEKGDYEKYSFLEDDVYDVVYDLVSEVNPFDWSCAEQDMFNLMAEDRKKIIDEIEKELERN